jgi:Stage II sporulation protein E (SpoIIE)
MAALATVPIPRESNQLLHLVATRVTSQSKTESSAFERAQLESERIRIPGVLAFVAIFIVVTLVRVFVIRSVSGKTSWGWNVTLGLALATYEGWMLQKVNSAFKGGHSLFNARWAVSTVLETLIPAFGMAFLTSGQFEFAYRPPASPAVLVFFIFIFIIIIILSILRLSPAICVLSGVFAVAGCLAAVVYLGWRPPVPGVPAPATQTSVSMYALILLIAGVAAAAIAGRIRTHVEAALREAETKRKLETIQHDPRVARPIQQSLLPKQAPKIVGFEIAGRHQPAEDTGGDYFDWKILPDGSVVVSLADITGHGIGPALLAAVDHAYVSSSFRVAQGLSPVPENINQALSSELGSGRFVTFADTKCGPDNPNLGSLSAGPIFIYSRSDVQVQGDAGAGGAAWHSAFLPFRCNEWKTSFGYPETMQTTMKRLRGSAMEPSNRMT